MSSSPTIIILGTVIANGGDRALLHAQRETLSEVAADRRVILTDFFPESARKLTELEVLPATGRVAPTRRTHRLLHLALRAALALSFAGAIRLVPTARRLKPSSEVMRTVLAIAAADVVITPAGTMIVPYRSSLPRFLDLAVAIVLGHRPIHYTQSLSLPTAAIDRTVAKWIFRRSTAIFVRSSSSAKVAEAMGADPSIVVESHDPAVYLDPSPVRHSESAALCLISTREWIHDSDPGSVDRYRVRLSELAGQLAEDGWEVRFVSTCQGVADYPIDDAREAERIAAAVRHEGPGRIVVDGDFHTPRDLIDLAGTASLVIATRLHFGMLSLIAGRAPVIIDYEGKAQEALGRLGLDDLVLPFSHVDECLGPRVDRVISDATAFEERVDAAMGAARATRPEHLRRVSISLSEAEQTRYRRAALVRCPGR